MKINEIFYSLQGEGFHTGVPSVFVRFSGCNLKCGFCDTEHNEGQMMEAEDIVEAVMQYPSSTRIVLTGGEPSMFIDYDFVAMLKERTGMQIAIETNGTHSLPDNIDWITLSPKYAPVVLDKCDELKVVYTGQDLEPYFGIEAKHYFLQPCYCSDERQRQANMEMTVDAVLADPRWRLSLQTHRFLGIR